MSAEPHVNQIVRAVSRQVWFRVGARFRSNVNFRDTREHPFAVLQDIIDSVYALLESPPALKVIFHCPGTEARFKPKNGEAFTAEFLFFRCRRDHVEKWLEALKGFLQPLPPGIPAAVLDKHENVEGIALARRAYSSRAPGTKSGRLTAPLSGEEARLVGDVLKRLGLHNRHFRIEHIGEIEERSLNAILEDRDADEGKDEYCLVFHTPFSPRFARTKGMPASHLSEKSFVETCCRRFGKLFGLRIKGVGIGKKTFKLLPFFWKSVQVRHHTPSFHNARMEIAGYAGPLYIKGADSFMHKLLVLMSEIHSGASLTCASGYFTLTDKPEPFFDGRLFEMGHYRAAAREILAGSRLARQSLAQNEGVNADECEFAERLLSDLRNGSYKPAPFYALEIKGKSGKRRVIERLPFRELALNTVLFRIIRGKLERSLRNSVIGYRRGVSREKAVGIIRDARIHGFKWAAESDISDFFPSVKHDILGKRLESILPSGDTRTLELVMACVGAPSIRNGEVRERLHGLAQGSPLSPLLANLYCAPLDEVLGGDDAVRYVRYGDDFIALTRTRQKAEETLQVAEEVLREMGLSLKAERTAVKQLSDGIEFLGFRFDDGAKREEFPVNPFRKTLYVARAFAFAGVNGGAVEISGGKNPSIVVPLRRLDSIVFLEPASFSTELLKRCSRMGVSIAATLEGGYSVGIIPPNARRMYDGLRRHESRMGEMSAAELLCAARRIISAKLCNYARLFQLFHAKGNGAIIGGIKKSVNRLEGVNTLKELRGVEGAAARLCFKGYNNCIRVQKFRIEKRGRNVGDRGNGLLNLGYYLLFSRLHCMVKARGLNPYLGMLHSPENRYESLVCDLQEPFRAFVDRVVIQAVNSGEIEDKDFHPTSKGLYLSPEKRRAFLMFYHRKFERRPRDGGLSLHDALSAQVNAVRRWVDEKGKLEFYHWGGEKKNG